tara:strand:- start:351 stop:701 length:351 start_codon:yes stop_codon:yes gene_type:complete
MAIPSGSGTEVLKRASVHSLTNSATALITGSANHIYTILSVVFTEQGGAGETISMYVEPDAGATKIRLMQDNQLKAYQTFAWNDKFVISGTDILKVETGDSANVDVWISYIEQDWS